VEFALARKWFIIKNAFCFATEGYITSAMTTFAVHRQHYALWALWVGSTEMQNEWKKSQGVIVLARMSQIRSERTLTIIEV
jgi:hypothetical protein